LRVLNKIGSWEAPRITRTIIRISGSGVIAVMFAANAFEGSRNYDGTSRTSISRAPGVPSVMLRGLAQGK
jgi:hypothetical protein